MRRRWVGAGLFVVILNPFLGQQFLSHACLRVHLSVLRAKANCHLHFNHTHFDLNRPETFRRFSRMERIGKFIGAESFSSLTSFDVAEERIDVRFVGAASRLRSLTSVSFIRCRFDNEDSLNLLADLPSLKGVLLDGCGLTGAVLRRLPRCGSLKMLVLDSNRITDSALAHLSKAKNLRELSLGSNHKISDAGIRNLRLDHLQLESLVLDRTGITDASIPELAKATKLKVLDVRWTRITPAGLNRLRHALPNCDVYGADRRS